MASNDKAGRLVCPEYKDLGIPALYVHDLTGTEDGDRLLSKQSPIHPASSSAIPLIRTLNKEVASYFSEKDNAVERIPLRLVTTEEVWDSTKYTAFQAVSYRWRDGSWKVPDRFKGTPEHWPMPISVAMLKMLLSSIDDGEALWIDQLCIDQNDLEHKAHAIANMDKIFHNAKSVPILLEDLDIDPEAEKSLYYLTNGSDADFEGTTSESIHVKAPKTVINENFKTCDAKGLTSPVAKLIEDIFSCSWFTRAWCRQEFNLNPNSTFLIVGHKHSCVALDPDFFTSIFVKVWNTCDPHQPQQQIAPSKFLQFIGSIAGKRETPEDLEKMSLCRLFVEIEQLDCLHVSDLIPIILNMAGLSLSFNKTITTRAECRFILSLLLIAAGHPSMLDSMGPPIHRPSEPGYQGVLCWPTEEDFRYWQNFGYAQMNTRPAIYHISPEIYASDVLFFRSSPVLPSPESSEKAEKSRKESKFAEACGYGDYADVVTQALAICHDIGFSWMKPSYNYFNRLKKKSFDDLDLTREGESSPEHITELTSIPDSYDIEKVAAVLQELFTELRRIKQDFPVLIPLDEEGTNHAVMFLPPHLKKDFLEKKGRYNFAIPVALNYSQSMYMRRLWILEETERADDARSIVGRGYFFGEELGPWMHVSYGEGFTIVGPWMDGGDEKCGFEEEWRVGGKSWSK